MQFIHNVNGDRSVQNYNKVILKIYYPQLYGLHVNAELSSGIFL